MSNITGLPNTIYDLLKVMGKDAEFLYDTIDSYVQDAENASKKELVDIWKKIFMKGKSSNTLFKRKDLILTVYGTVVSVQIRITYQIMFSRKTYGGSVWRSINCRRSNRCNKNRVDDLKKKIIQYNGIMVPNGRSIKSTLRTCGICEFYILNSEIWVLSSIFFVVMSCNNFQEVNSRNV